MVEEHEFWESRFYKIGARAEIAADKAVDLKAFLVDQRIVADSILQTRAEAYEARFILARIRLPHVVALRAYPSLRTLH